HAESAATARTASASPAARPALTFVATISRRRTVAAPRLQGRPLARPPAPREGVLTVKVARAACLLAGKHLTTKSRPSGLSQSRRLSVSSDPCGCLGPGLASRHGGQGPR